MPATKLASKQIKGNNTDVKTANYTAADRERVLVDTTALALNITLPTGVEGMSITVQDVGGAATTNNITVVGTINGAVNYVISDNFGNVDLLFSDGDWIIVSKEPSGGGGGGGGGLTVVSTKTANYTAASNEDIPVNPTAASFNVTLPLAPAHGDKIRIADVSGVASANPVSIIRNGNNINGIASDVSFDVDLGEATLTYYTTFGWILT